MSFISPIMQKLRFYGAAGGVPTSRGADGRGGFPHAGGFSGGIPGGFHERKEGPSVEEVD